MDFKASVRQTVEDHGSAIVDLSTKIHDHPELAFEEVKASNWCKELLVANGFDVESPVADLDTAFRATFGNGELNLAFCAEYDALPDIGHACGHNIIAASSIATALALKPIADELNVTLTVLGTPAEESGSGKILMLERGAFNGIHATLTVHPGVTNFSLRKILGFAVFDIEYLGKEAHASSNPSSGTNAADALTVAQVAIGLLRQQLPPSAQVHGITKLIEGAPNIIPGRATAQYYVRAADNDTLAAAIESVKNCFEAGAIATRCSLNITSPEPICEVFKNDEQIAALFRSNAEQLGYTFNELRAPAASTDLGNISQVIPSIHPSIAIEVTDGCVPHQKEYAAAAAGPAAEKALMDSSLALAWTAVDVASDKSIRNRLLHNDRP